MLRCLLRLSQKQMEGMGGKLSQVVLDHRPRSLVKLPLPGEATRRSHPAIQPSTRFINFRVTSAFNSTKHSFLESQMLSNIPIHTGISKCHLIGRRPTKSKHGSALHPHPLPHLRERLPSSASMKLLVLRRNKGSAYMLRPVSDLHL